MSSWSISLTLEDIILDFLILCTLILIGTLARRYIKFFQKFLIPNNLIAGTIGLVAGSQVLGWIDLPEARLTSYIYHLLALTFIALGLRKQKTHWGRGPVSKALASMTTVCMQAVIGLGLSLAFVYFINPEMFPGFGLLLPLGFGMGPGLAANFGKDWQAYGFEGGAAVGLTFAAIGFVFAYFVGVALIQWGIKKGKCVCIKDMANVSSDMRSGVYKTTKYPIAGHLTMPTEAIEPMAFQYALIGFVYLLNYIFLSILSIPLKNAGLDEFVGIIWNFHFVFGLIIALIVRKILDKTGRGYVVDKGLMTRSMGVFLDFLIVGAIAGISISSLAGYWPAILLMCAITGPLTYFYLSWLAPRIFDDFHFERLIELFGELTGTIHSGLVLLRVTDPEFETPVAEDAVYGSGISLFIGLPLLFSLGIPMTFFNNSLNGYWVTFGIIFGYWMILMIVWKLTGLMKPKAG